MISLQNILGTKGQEFLDNLLNKEVIVSEKLNASTLSFQKKQTSEMDMNRKLTFYKGSGTNKKEITIADRVMTTFYSSGMTYISNLSNLIIDRIPANWTFVCKYFPNHQPSFINYSILPKNNLVLSCIITSGGVKLEDVDDLRSWAELFDIAYQEPVFRGYLTQYQKDRLSDYINDSSNNKESFSRFIITLLNPSLTHSLYQNDGFDTPIDGFIFKFISDDGITKPLSAKLIDPYMSNIILKNKSGKNFKDNTDILLSDFTIFMSSQDLDSIVLHSDSEAERYLELFYRIFNRYIKYKKEQLEDFDIDTNDVVKESIDVDFSVDIDQITNETTKKLLKDNPEYKSIFKALLGSLKTKKPENYKSLVMSPGVVRLFNDMVDKISMKTLNKDIEDDLSFTSYLNTLKKKDIIDLDNAIKSSEPKVPVQNNLEVKDNDAVLSFADFKKKDKKEEEDKKEKKEIKSIEDMIKDLTKSFDKLSSDIKDLKSDNKELKSDVEETKDEIKEDDKSDDKSDEKSDEKDEKSSSTPEHSSKDDDNDMNEDENEDEEETGDEEEQNDDNKDDSSNEENNDDSSDDGDDEKSKKEKDEKPTLGGL